MIATLIDYTSINSKVISLAICRSIGLIYPTHYADSNVTESTVLVVVFKVSEKLSKFCCIAALYVTH